MSFALTPSDDTNLSDYTVDAVLVAENVLCNNGCSGNVHPYIAAEWKDMEAKDNSVIFELTADQTMALKPGGYFIEIALYSRGATAILKKQTRALITLLPSFTR